jgi:hypothetical protein
LKSYFYSHIQDERKLKRGNVDRDAEDESNRSKKSKLSNENNVIGTNVLEPKLENEQDDMDASKQSSGQEMEEISSSKRRIMEAMNDNDSESSDEETMRIF